MATCAILRSQSSQSTSTSCTSLGRVRLSWYAWGWCVRFRVHREEEGHQGFILQLDAILWMDESLHHLRDPGMIIPQQIPANTGFPCYESGAGYFVHPQ